LIHIAISAHPFAMRYLVWQTLVAFFFDTGTCASIASNRISIVTFFSRIYYAVSTKLRCTYGSLSFYLSAGIPRFYFALVGAAISVYKVAIVALFVIPG
jgi:hypothetical protein